MPAVKLRVFLRARLCPNLKNCLMQGTARFPSCVFWLIGRCGCVLKDRFNSANNCHSMVLYIKPLILCLWFWISDFDTTPEKLAIILELWKKNVLCLRGDSWKNQIIGLLSKKKSYAFYYRDITIIDTGNRALKQQNLKPSSSFRQLFFSLYVI